MSGVIPSPNIWGSPDVYEIENNAVDRPGLIEAEMAGILGRPWAGLRVLDVGSGTGFHVERFARLGAVAVGVEPHGPLVSLAAQRLSRYAESVVGLEGLAPGVIQAGADALPLADHSVDVAHARWAYFFGPGCEPGLAELDRVMRPGGTAFIIDNDATRSTFGRWFARALPAYDSIAIERFWTRRGWQRSAVTIRWDFDSRADFEAALAIEFAPDQVERILGERPPDHPDARGVDYAINLWWRRY